MKEKDEKMYGILTENNNFSGFLSKKRLDKAIDEERHHMKKIHVYQLIEIHEPEYQIKKV